MRTPAPCRCKLARHTHGTSAAYRQCGCRCYPCTAAYLARERARRRGEPMPPRQAAHIDATGTRRRIQALHVLGYSDREIADRLGKTFQEVHKMRSLLARILPGTAEAVARVYEQLWDKPSIGPHAAKVRALAARKGWHPPMAWDDIDNPDDDPDAAPEPLPAVSEVEVQMIVAGLVRVGRGDRSPELKEAVRRLAERGMDDRQIGQRVGREANAITVMRRRAGIPAGQPTTRRTA